MDEIKKYGLYLMRSAVIMTAFLLSAGILLSQVVQKPTRQSSLEAYSKGDYELALTQFSELLQAYPGDPLYKYYTGVCLVRMKRDPEKAASLLSQAMQGTAAVRSIPPDVHFWLGRARQMAGKFKDAISSYNLFTEMNGKKAARDLDVETYINQCKREEGELSPPIQIVEAEKNNVITENIQPGPSSQDTLTSDFDNVLDYALELQRMADSVYNAAEEQKKGLTDGSYTGRTKLKSIIADTEALADSLQQEADRKYEEAQRAMNTTTFSGIKTKPDSGKAVPSSGKAMSLPSRTSGSDTILINTSVAERKNDVNPPEDGQVSDTINKAVKIFTRPVTAAGVFSVFEIRKDGSDEKIEINPPGPEGLVYRIQVAVFRNPVAVSYFKGITPVNGFRVEGRDLTIYYAGLFRRLADAVNALASVRNLGFRDAFVASLFEGKPVTPEKAAILEKEWGGKPLYSLSGENTPADTIPPTLIFRVEVARSAKPLKEDVLEPITKIAGARGLEIITLDDGSLVYLIGMFITWESAEEYTDLLKRNGFEDAKVGAWLGRKEIPVETARELFERIE